MKIPENKKEFLQRMGLSDQDLANIESTADKLQLKRSATGVLVREDGASEETEPVQPVATQTNQATQPVGIAIDENLLREIADGVSLVLKPLQDQIATLTAKVQALEEGNLVRETAKVTPKLSFGDLLQRQLHGTSEAQLDPRTKATLLRSSPEPTNVPKLTGVPFIDGILAKQGGV